MERGTVPLRHSSSVPFMVRLPRRFEVYQQQPIRRRASLQPLDSENREFMNTRRASLQLSPVSDDENARIHDLNVAIQWLTQELIFIRQHDVLLRRLFHQIRRTLTNLTCRKEVSSPSDKGSTDYSGDSPDFDYADSLINSCMLRSASSHTTLNESDESDSDSDFRSRSASSVTSRDLAAAARRRGSKEFYV